MGTERHKVGWPGPALLVVAVGLGGWAAAAWSVLAPIGPARGLAAGAAGLLLLLAAAVLVHVLLLRPLRLATAALERAQQGDRQLLPRSRLGDIDRFYRAAEHIAAALADVAEANRQARAAQADLRRLASVDELTGVANRRYFSAMASRELDRCRRFKHPLALLMLDIDHFKRVNDTLGHAVGDDVLKAFTRALEHNLRSVDLLGRMGGEEFAVLLPESDENAANITAERLRSAVQALEVTSAQGGSALRITASLGIAIFTGKGDESLDSLLARADSGLYTAKRNGRNRVVLN